MAPDKLVLMANQIGTVFISQGLESAAADTAAHLRKF